MAESAPTEAKEPQVQPLGPYGLQPAEYRRTVFVAIAAKGVRPEDVLDRAYWAHVSAGLKAWDRIEVRAEDGTWYEEVMVLEASRSWAAVKTVVGPVFLSTADVSQSQAEPTGYEIMHRGPKKWSVVRTKDRAVMHEGEQTKDGAAQWMKDNADRLKAPAPV